MIFVGRDGRVSYRCVDDVVAWIDELADLRLRVRQPQAHGVSSLIYRLPENVSTSIPTPNGVCIKRVSTDAQRPPHNPRREAAACIVLWDSPAGDDPGCSFIMSFLAAFKDLSCDLGVVYDIVMPWYPCTFADLLNEAAMRDSGSKHICDAMTLADYEGAPDRPALAIAVNLCVSYTKYVRFTMQSLFAALRFLHTEGIAHRDIKPSNIVIEDRNGTIKLIDFGTCWLPPRLDRRGDDGAGGMITTVGTRPYSSPESMFSPTSDSPWPIDAYAVDVWAAAATLAEFWMPLQSVDLPPGSPAKVEDLTPWEVALGDGQTWTELGDGFADHPSPPEPAEEIDATPSGFRRETLFEGGFGDLGLAHSIFSLLGLPEDAEAWPEALSFQPPLDKMPWEARPPAKGGLSGRLGGRDPAAIAVLDGCLKLSARGRISAYVACLEMQGL